MFIATLIASDRLASADLDQAAGALDAAGAILRPRQWLDDGVAADIPFAGIEPPAARAALEGLIPGVDIIVQAETGRAKKLLVADMDSTMITCECIDELADYAGLKDEIAAVTERAMQGELDFEAALEARVKLLIGLGAEMLDRCREERVKLMPGARTLVQTMRERGARTVLVSGGFTVFAEPVASAIGFHRSLANRLIIEYSKLAGRVALPIVGAQTKRETLLNEMAALGITADRTLAVGDGANDIPMIQAAGLGVAYRGKPKTAAAADAKVDHGDLTALLYAQGYARQHWTS